MNNLLQDISKFLTKETFLKIRVNIGKDYNIDDLFKKHFGYIPRSIRDLGDLYVKVSNQFHLRKEGNELELCNFNKESILFEIIEVDKMMYLNAKYMFFEDISRFKKMINSFKDFYVDFHIETCKIIHDENIVVTISTKRGLFILPVYVYIVI